MRFSILILALSVACTTAPVGTSARCHAYAKIVAELAEEVGTDTDTPEAIEYARLAAVLSGPVCAEIFPTSEAP